MSTVVEDRKDGKGPFFDAIQELHNVAAGIGTKLREVPDGVPAGAKVLVDSGIATGESPQIERLPLTDEEIYQKVAVFLDPHFLGPIFVSKPIRGKVFVCVYPRQREMLNAHRITGRGIDSMPEDLYLALTWIGELREVCAGWLPENDLRIEQVLCNLDRREKWPKMNPVDFYETRDPRAFEFEVKPLWEQYSLWKAAVEPTEEDFSKYYSLMR